jgi:hypothetical protein
MKWNLTMDEGLTFDAGSSMAARAIRRDVLQAFFDRGDFNKKTQKAFRLRAFTVSSPLVAIVVL